MARSPQDLAFVLIDFLFTFLINKFFVILIIRLQNTDRPSSSKTRTAFRQRQKAAP